MAGSGDWYEGLGLIEHVVVDDDEHEHRTLCVRFPHNLADVAGREHCLIRIVL